MNRVIFYSLVSFLIGVGVASLTSFSLLTVALGVVVGTAFYAMLLVRIRAGKQKTFLKHVYIVGVFLLCFLLGGLRFVSLQNSLDNETLFVFGDRKVSLVGEVLSEQVKNGKKRIVFEVGRLSDGIESIKVHKEKVLVYTGEFSDIVYGDQIFVSGVLQEVLNTKGKQEFDFDYKNYLRKDGINFQMFSPDIEVVGKEGGSSLLKFLFGLKDIFISNIDTYIGEPASTLASGMVIAGKGGIPKSLEEDFIKVGLIHIVVLSGYNISLIISFVAHLFARVRPKVRTIIIITFVVLFVLMAGASAPLLRASIMASIVLFGKLSNRSINQNRVLLLSASIMVFHNSYILVFDPSFQLSFLATFAIINIAPVFKQRLTFVTEKFLFREVLSQTLAVEVLVAPFLFIKMGTFSLVAPLANILVLPLVPFIMLLSITVGIFGGIPGVGVVFGFVTEALMSVVLFIVEFFANLPFASFD